MKKKEIILIITSVFIISIIWIIFNVYHNLITSTISETLSARILPINPNFDTKTIEKLKKRKKISPIFESKTTSQIATGSAIIPTISSLPSPTIIQLISPTMTPGSQSGGFLP